MIGACRQPTANGILSSNKGLAMKVKELIQKLNEFDNETEIEFIVSDENDNWDSAALYLNSYGGEDTEEVLELTLQLKEGLSIQTES